MKILSLFDGMACARIALDKLGVTVDTYYASEIDKYAIAVAKHNYPDIIHVGDITKLNGNDFRDIDLVIGGSPCQGFSFAGKQFNFDDPRSKLFFDFVRILKQVKPRYFLLENVKMRKDYQSVISDLLGVQPIEINSALVSAQNRKRLYWTNIPNVTQPEDKGIVLKHILEDNAEICGRQVGRRLKDGKRADYDKSIKSQQRIEPRLDEKSGALTTVQKDNLVGCKKLTVTTNKGEGSKIAFKPSKDGLHHVANATDINGNDCLKRVYHPEGKSPTLSTCQGGNTEPKVLTDNLSWRKLTPLECERLQTVPDNYTLVPWQKRMMSNTQRYKMLGNGYTVDVITHILKGAL